MKFRPLHDRVVVRRVEEETTTSGGIIIPETAQEKPSQGEIVAVGQGARGEDGKVVPLDVKVGDRVIFGKWSVMCRFAKLRTKIFSITATRLASYSARCPSQTGNCRLYVG